MKLRLAVLLVAVPCLTAVPASAANPALDDARKLTTRATVEYDVGHFEQALDLYTKAYERYPKPALLFDIGQCHRLLGHYERAIFFYQGYLRGKPDAANRSMVEQFIADSQRQLDAQRAAAGRLDVDYFYGVRNWAYTAQGEPALQPSEVSDNGQVTVFRFPGNTEVPVIYEVKADGTESIVPRTVRGDNIVVDAIARQFRIRAGRQALCIFNRRYDPIGQHQNTGTVSPDVSRQLKEDAP